MVLFIYIWNENDSNFVVLSVWAWERVYKWKLIGNISVTLFVLGSECEPQPHQAGGNIPFLAAGADRDAEPQQYPRDRAPRFRRPREPAESGPQQQPDHR